ncbi:hypothetical protein [Methyloprofundus sp.]|uniref:hypothetical protein n=1 Tax=Methyloprofundus sp. TaxID=2020875 RepID=UPI003D152E51
MLVSQYLQSFQLRKVSNDEKYLGMGAELSPEIMHLIHTEKELVCNQAYYHSGCQTLQLDEHELALAS